MSHRNEAFLALALIFLGGITATRADDLYVSIPLKSLHLVDAKLPEPGNNFTSTDRAELYPRVAVVVAGAEAYLKTSISETDRYWNSTDVLRDARVVFRLPKAQDVSGHLFLPKADVSGQVALAFTLSAKDEATSSGARDDFLQGKRLYYSVLADGNLPGAAWFRHEQREAEAALGGKFHRNVRNIQSDDDTGEFDIFTGGRALAENLQLDRALQGPPSDKPPVALSTLEGITVKKFEWAPLMKGMHPALDPLASLIPADQHAIFLPDAKALTAFIGEAGRSTLPILEYIGQQNVRDESMAERYSRQLCLPLATLDTELPAGHVASIAVTGSDPSLRTGSEVTLLFEARDNAADKLRAELDAVLRGNAKPLSGVDVREARASAAAPAYISFLAPDRGISAYLATIGNAVIVTNSLQQLERAASVDAKKTPSLASLDEYRFFRNRYPRGDSDETALVIISDDTIRRWCGPKLRIASAMRTRAAAVLAELEAASLENPDVPLTAPEHLHMGKLTRVNGHIRSERFNTLAFLTPADELEFTEVSAADAISYQRWRDTYQEDWQNYFDPIAVRLSLGKQRVAADLTVMPLIENSTYKTGYFSYLHGQFTDHAADPHADLLHVVVGLDAKKPPLSDTLGSVLPLPGTEKGANPLSWLGNNAALYVDDDPFWQELAKAEKPEEYLEQNAAKIPAALRFSSGNDLGLAAFLTAVRTYVDSSAPGMINYTVLNYKEQPYVKVAAARPDEANLGEFKDLAVYYVPMHGSLLVTLNEPLLKRAIDRRAAATQPANPPASEPAITPWLGKTMAVHLDASLLQLDALAEGNSRSLQQKAWAPTPVLNDLKRLRPEADAVALFRETFHEMPADPLFGTYTWDANLQTYTSSTLGSPAAEKTAKLLPPEMASLKMLDFGVTIEDNNLRAKAILQRTP